MAGASGVPNIALTEVSDVFYYEVPLSVWAPPEINLDDLNISDYDINIGDAPTTTLTFTPPTLDTLSELSPVDLTLVLTWPELSAEKPVLDFSGAPGDLDVDAYNPGTPPETSDIELPTEPDLTMPEAPTIREIAIPETPEVSIEDFDKTLVLQDLPAVGALDFVYTAYNDEVEKTVIARYLAKLMLGGTGLEASVEDAIFARETYRVEQTFQKNLEDSLGFFESRGWSLPSGMLGAKFDELSKAKALALADSSNGITVKQAELAQSNDQFLIKTGVDLTQILQAFFIEETKIRLEAARAVAENNIAILNAAIQTNNQAIQAFNAQAQVYEVKVRAALAKIEIFKAQIEAAKLDAETQKLYVDIYNALLQGVLAEVEVYKTRMQGAEIAMGIQKTKLEVYTARIGAFTAMVQAWATQWKAYETKISGQTARVQAYQTEVSAYQTEVEATKAVASVKIEEARIKLEGNKLTIQENEAKLAKYNAELSAAVAKLQSNVQVHSANVEAYKATVSALTAKYDAYYKAGQLRIELAKAKASVAVDVAKLSSAVALTNSQGQWEMGKAAISGTATVRAAIAGQTHKSGTASNTASTSDSTVNQTTQSQSDSTSTVQQVQSITSMNGNTSVIYQHISEG